MTSSCHDGQLHSKDVQEEGNSSIAVSVAKTPLLKRSLGLSSCRRQKIIPASPPPDFQTSSRALGTNDMNQALTEHELQSFDVEDKKLPSSYIEVSVGPEDISIGHIRNRIGYTVPHTLSRGSRFAATPRLCMSNPVNSSNWIESCAVPEDDVHDMHLLDEQAGRLLQKRGVSDSIKATILNQFLLIMYRPRTNDIIRGKKLFVE